MTDSRIKRAAKILVDYSTNVKKGENVQIIADPQAEELALCVYENVIKKGAFPLVHMGLRGSSQVYYKYASEEQIKKFPTIAMYELKNTDVVIYLGAPENVKELSNVPPKKISLRSKTMHPYNEYRVSKTRWCIFYCPTNSLAQEAGMSLSDFEKFVFKATNRDWNKVKAGHLKLKKILDKGKHVRIVGKNTDISFSIKGRQAITADGGYNMPDGEVFMGPDEKTTEGHIEYSYPAIYNGKEVDGIRLWFKKGKVVKAKASKNEKFLRTMINTDRGASYLGEFGIGTNYNIKKFVKNILFDEKIGGSIHLALGSAYKQGGGKNRSAIHWDMIKDLRKGGKIIVDGKVIQENGKFNFEL